LNGGKRAVRLEYEGLTHLIEVIGGGVAAVGSKSAATGGWSEGEGGGQLAGGCNRRSAGTW